MTVTRREFIVKAGTVAAGIRFLSPIVVRAGEALGQTAVDPATAARNRLIVLFQQGGNDGLNTVIPTADVSGAPRYSVYKQVRPTIAYDPTATLPLNRTSDDSARAMGLNKKLNTIHRLYTDGRVAIVQGVDYPAHSYSHFVSTDIWESGEPGQAIDSGWVGRHLDRAGIGPGELRGLGVGYELPLILQGRERRGVEVESVQGTHFLDLSTPEADARHAAFARYGLHPASEPLRAFAGQQAKFTVDLVNALEGVRPPPRGKGPVVDSLLTARVLLEQNLGVECVFVTQPGYDTHTTQVSQQERLLQQLDEGIEAFYFGTVAGTPLAGVPPLAPDLAARTLIVSTSEFGRRIGENGTGVNVAGTDHGAAGPLFVIGPPFGSTTAGVRLVPGLHRDHPNMGTPTLPADNLTMTTELRQVYQAVLENWVKDPEPLYSAYPALPGLFVPA